MSDPTSSLESTLLGQPGATQGFAAVIVPPSSGEDDAPPTGIAEDLSSFAAAPRKRISRGEDDMPPTGIAEDLSSIRRGSAQAY